MHQNHAYSSHKGLVTANFELEGAPGFAPGSRLAILRKIKRSGAEKVLEQVQNQLHRILTRRSAEIKPFEMAAIGQ